MEVANRLARERRILSGANFLEITDQAMTTDVDFCQVFQATCRHSRQKWFEIASFPIFNVGGLGSLEELGITLCNMKLSIMERVPIILFDTEGERAFWDGMRQQIATMVKHQRAPAWIEDHVVITDDPAVVTDVYRRRLQLFWSHPSAPVTQSIQQLNFKAGSLGDPGNALGHGQDGVCLGHAVQPAEGFFRTKTRHAAGRLQSSEEKLGPVCLAGDLFCQDGFNDGQGGVILPGHHAMVGSRIPPSQVV